MKRQNLIKEDWDICIVLDACRFDYFSECYEKYSNFDGSILEKRRSPGSNTSEWLRKTFTGNHNYLYFSGNPYVNTGGISLKQINDICSSDWRASDHFESIVNVWDESWNESLETLHPKNMNDSVIEHLDLIDEANRTIIHYMQPHRPFLTRHSNCTSNREGFSVFRKGLNKAGRVIAPSRKWLNSKGLSDIQAAKVRRLLGGRLNLWEKKYLKGDIDKLKRYYKQNLQTVLKYVNELLPALSGRIIITADHGEAFGEGGDLEHKPGSSNPVLRTVPWLVISNKEN